MDPRLTLQLTIAFVVVGILALTTGLAIYFGLTWALKHDRPRRCLHAIPSAIGFAAAGAAVGIVSGFWFVAVILAPTLGAFGFIRGFSRSCRGSTLSLNLQGQHSEDDYRRAGFADDDIVASGVDQVGAPPSDVEPPKAVNLVGRDDPWDADLWREENVNPFDGSDPDDFNLKVW